MKWKEYLLNQIPGYSLLKSVKNINNHGIVEGYTKTLKDVYVENMPGVGHVYDLGKHEGKHEGMKEGYIRASSEYEKKLLKQAEEFLNQKRGLADNIQERDELLDKYEKCIGDMEAEFNSLTSEQRTLLDEMKALKEKLKEYTSS